MKNSLETRLGIFVALAIVAALVLFELVGGLETFQRGYKLYALFNTVQDLKEGDRVKMAGVEVGRVHEIGFAEADNKVRVGFKVRKNVKVKTDSVATIRFTGLMGQNFVSLDFGSRSAPTAAPGTILASAEQPDLGAVMAKIDNVASGVENLTKSFSGDNIANLVGPLMDFVEANKAPLTATIANMQAISRQIAEGEGTVGKLIYDDALYNSSLATITNLQDAAVEIKTTVADARTVVDQAKLITEQVNAGKGTVGLLVKDEALYREATASMQNLREITGKINQGQGSVGKILNDRELYDNAKLTLQKLDKATEGIEDQGPLSVMGLLVNSLF